MVTCLLIGFPHQVVKSGKPRIYVLYILARKCGPGLSSIHITWDFVRNANLGHHPRPTESIPAFQQVLNWFICTLKFDKHCSLVRSLGFVFKGAFCTSGKWSACFSGVKFRNKKLHLLITVMLLIEMFLYILSVNHKTSSSFLSFLM